MLQSFGAGFFVLALLGVLAVFAIVGTLLAFVVLTLEEQGDTAQEIFRVIAIVVATVAVALTTFGVLLVYDEAPVALVLFVGLVFLPLALVVAERTRDAAWSARDAIAAAALSWSPGFVLAGTILLGLLARTDVAFPVATALATAVAVVASLLVGRQLRRVGWPGGSA